MPTLGELVFLVEVSHQEAKWAISLKPRLKLGCCYGIQFELP